MKRYRTVTATREEPYIECDGPNHEGQRELEDGVAFTLHASYGSVTMDTCDDNAYRHFCGPVCLREGANAIADAEILVSARLTFEREQAKTERAIEFEVARELKSARVTKRRRPV